VAFIRRGDASTRLGRGSVVTEMLERKRAARGPAAPSLERERPKNVSIRDVATPGGARADHAS
jgi:hypothetical protein